MDKTRFIPKVETKEDYHNNRYDIQIKNGRFKIYFTEKYATIQLLGDIMVGFFFVFGSLANLLGAPPEVAMSAYLIGSLSLSVRPILKIIRRTWFYNDDNEEDEDLTDYQQTKPLPERYHRVKEQAVHINGEFSDDAQEAFLDRGELKEEEGLEVKRAGAHFVDASVGASSPKVINEYESREEKMSTSLTGDQPADKPSIQRYAEKDTDDMDQENKDSSKEDINEAVEPDEDDQSSDASPEDRSADRGFYHHDIDENGKSNEDEQPLSVDVDKRKND